MPSAEIISIGTEILLGEIVDTNAQFIARALRDIGVDIYWKTTVGDNARRIAQAIQQAMQRSDIIITSGGLGPTVDDPTREGVALAIGAGVEYRPELWEQIQARFRRYGRLPTENNKRQAYIPQGATAIENPVGTAPSFLVRHVLDGTEHLIFSLPGVPREMEYLLENAVLPQLREHYALKGVIKARVLHTAGVGESQIDDVIGDLEELSNPTVGLAAHSGQVDVRIVAKAGSMQEADSMIQRIEEELRRRLGSMIYGVDEETLENAVLQALKKHGWTLAFIEAGLGGELIRRLAFDPEFILKGEALTARPGESELVQATSDYRQRLGAAVGLGVSLIPGPDRQVAHIALITPEEEQVITRSYGGAPGYASRWAVNQSLDLIRNL